MPTYVVTDPSTGKKVRLTGDAPPSDQDLDEIFASLPQDKSFLQKTGDAIVAGAKEAGDVLMESVAGVNRGAAKTADFFLTTPFNTASELTNFSNNPRRFKLPTIESALSPATTGGYMQNGLAKDIVGGAGEIIPSAVATGGLLRNMAGALPKAGISTGGSQTLPTAMPAVDSLGAATVKGIAGGSKVSDAALGATSAVGGELGEEVGGQTGKLIGSIAAPIAGLSLKGIFDLGSSGVKTLSSSMKEMSEEGRNKLMARAMVQSGMSPEEVAKRYAELGDEAALADVGNLSSLLNVAKNASPRVSGQAFNMIKDRQKGQASRIFGSLEDATGTSGLNVDDEIIRRRNDVAPKLKELYDEARATPFEPSKKLENIFENSPALASAKKEAEKSLADLQAIGEDVTPMSMIDETKKVLDAKVKKAVMEGDGATASRLLKIKKVMIDEADAQAPVYKQARDLFAGEAALKDAAELGMNFRKTNPKLLQELTADMGRSEKDMYVLGAKQDILNAIEGAQINSDITRLFNKNGDIHKLKTLFDTPEAFDHFKNTLDVESQFIRTRNALGNSTTFQQAEAGASAQLALTDAAESVSNPLAAARTLGKIMGGLGKKRDSEAYKESLEMAGDILLAKGLKPEDIVSMLKSGNKERIELTLKNVIPRKTKLVAPILVGQSENKEEAKQ